MAVLFNSLPDPETVAILGAPTAALVESNAKHRMGIFTPDSAMMYKMRHEGLTPSDARIAEGQEKEFGHLTDPLLYKQKLRGL